MGGAGMDPSFVSGLERGEFSVSVVALAKQARAAGLRVVSV
jgi:hypothetical protein